MNELMFTCKNIGKPHRHMFSEYKAHMRFQLYEVQVLNYVIEFSMMGSLNRKGHEEIFQDEGNVLYLIIMVVTCVSRCSN